MDAKTCFVEGFHSIEVIDNGMIVTADCLHVTGSILELAPSAERNPRPNSEPAAVQPAPSSLSKKGP